MPSTQINGHAHVKKKVLIANRGEIARRVAKSCHELGLEPVMIYTQPDALSMHVLEATTKVCLGESSREYTNAEKLVEVAKQQGCVAVHPGYGFLSESAEFVEAIEAAGIAFLGPSAETMRMFSKKHTAREFAISADVPVLPGSNLVQTEEEAIREAEKTGYPVLLKATSGGGGIGISFGRSREEVAKNFAASVRLGAANFGDAGVFVEKYVERARHIEIQIFGDGKGNILALGERECSIQRRNQKVVEESPSPYVDPAFRQTLVEAAKRLGEAAKYRSAGTVEFLVDQDTHKFYFLEVNTRLQSGMIDSVNQSACAAAEMEVEHGITEYISGTDLVNWQLQLQIPGLPESTLGSYKPKVEGWAIECRICAEDPFNNFAPSSGMLGFVAWPEQVKNPNSGVRVDTWVETGTEISPFYDSLIAKLMVHASSRGEAVKKMQMALEGTHVSGIPTNLEYLKAILASEGYGTGATTTKFLESLQFQPRAVEVLDPGMGTTIQDYPGRVGYWHVGVPPSGPMDSKSFRLANALVGNLSNAAALEISLKGPSLKFHIDSVIALCGAEFQAHANKEAVPSWQSFQVKAGTTLEIKGLKGTGGARAYLAVAGGFDVPAYLGSRATFPGGKLGGTQGRPLRKGDLLPVAKGADIAAQSLQVPESWRPSFAKKDKVWEVGVLPGPNAEPDYFAADDISEFYSKPYSVHYNSNRLGIRLQGPKPRFARESGGEGGSHPSNVHDHVYALGTINYTGDMPVVLMFDGPSLGGFVCPATITSSEIWKMGQVTANDTVYFKKQTLEQAYTDRAKFDHAVELLASAAKGKKSGQSLEEALEGFNPELSDMPETRAVLASAPASDSHPGALYRLAGDRYVFVEYGPMELDLNLRVRIDELEHHLAAQNIEGLLETSPGVRSCMIEYDAMKLPLKKLLAILLEAEKQLPMASDQVLKTRILHLPMAFDESKTNAAVQKYMRSIRSEGPYLPSNVDFVAANNGIKDGKAGVSKVVFDASYMVLGLGDVYLGAPCAVPVDPRHRLVVPKYNPARTFTPEGAVGIGGSYMCIYPMDSPGGYQLIGRTLPIWNTFGRAGPFTPSKPWLLKIFDQVRFYRVEEAELEKMRKQFHTNELQIQIEESTFDMKEYNAFVASIAGEVEHMKQIQADALAIQTKLDAESLERLQQAEAAKEAEQAKNPSAVNGSSEDVEEITAAFTANVWDVKCKAGDEVKQGQTLVILEAMKMEFPVAATQAGKIVEIHVESSDLTQQGDILITLALNKATKPEE